MLDGIATLNLAPEPPRAFLFHCAPKAESLRSDASNWQFSLREMNGEPREKKFPDFEALVEFLRLELGAASTITKNQNAPAAVELGDVESWVPLVEDALRHLFDLLHLGEHPLTALALVEKQLCLRDGESAGFLERAKALSQVLVQALGELAPDGPEPNKHTPPHRAWHPFLILRDSYLCCEPNRNIMCWLQIGEGTFNRTRRRALRTLARALYEMERAAEIE